MLIGLVIGFISGVIVGVIAPRIRMFIYDLKKGGMG